MPRFANTAVLAWTLTVAACASRAMPPPTSCPPASPTPVATASSSPPTAAASSEPIVDGASVVRTPVTVNGRAFIEIRTPRATFLLPRSADPPHCTTSILADGPFVAATAISAAIVAGHVLVATERWERPQQATIAWTLDLAHPSPHEEAWPRAVAPRAFVHAGAIGLSVWLQGAGSSFRRYPQGALPHDADRAMPELSSVRGIASSPDGSLFVWDARAMSEEGSPASTLSRIAPDGSITRTAGMQHGVILGVLPDANGAQLWRSPIGGHRGSFTTLQRLSNALVAQNDLAVLDPIEGFYYRCPFYALETDASSDPHGRLVCGDGETYTLARDVVRPGLAFGANVVAYANGFVPLAARATPDAHEIVVETFGGPIARFPVRGVVHGAALAAEGSRIVLAWTDGADRDAPGTRRVIASIDCR